MKLTLLMAGCLVACTLSAQTPAEQAKKIDAILKQSNGFAGSKFKLVNQSFSLESVQVNIENGAEKAKIIFSEIPWKGFEYDVEETDLDPSLSKVEISFLNEAEVAYKEFINGKLEDDKPGEVVTFFVRSTDARQMEQALENFYIATWPELSRIQQMSKQSLINYITPVLNDALKSERGRVKSISECEMILDIDGDIVQMPTKIHQVHGEEGADDEMAAIICYGSKKAIIKTNSDMDIEEHPDFLLDISTLEKAKPLEFALKCLSKACK